MLLYWHFNNPISFKKVRKKTKVKLLHSYETIFVDLLVLAIPALIIFTVFFVPKMIYEPGFSLIGNIQSVSEETNRGFSFFSDMLVLSFTWATFSLTWLGWILSLVGLGLLFKDKKLVAIALLAWFFFFFMYLGNIISTSPRFVIPALVAPVMLSAFALDQIRLRYDVASVGIILFIIIVWMMTNIYPVIDYRRGYCGPCEFSKKIGATVGPNARVMAMDESQHYEYYAGTTSIGHPGGKDILDPMKVQASLDFIDGLLRNDTPVYATTQGLGYDVLVEGLLGYDSGQMLLKNMITGRVFKNLKFDPQRRELYDMNSNTVLPLTGLYGLELFNRFSVKPVFALESEDWHHKGITSGRYTAVLYKISLRDDSDERS